MSARKKAEKRDRHEKREKERKRRFGVNAIISLHSGRHHQSCTAGGDRTSHGFTSISVSKGSFRWRLAWRVTDVCESTQYECENFPNWWLKTIIVLRIAAGEGEHPDGSSVASKGSQGHPSAPVQLRLRPSTFAVATDTTTGELFNFLLA